MKLPKIMCLLVGLLTLSLSSCGFTYFRAVPVDPQTGYFPTASTFNQATPERKAPVLINRKTNLAHYHGNVLVTAGTFWAREVRYMGAFRHVMNSADLQKKIIRAGLAHRIKSLNSLLDLHHAYKVWGPFLWIHVQINAASGNRHGMRKAELIVTDPLTTRNLFVTRERFRFFFSKNVNDQNTFYPLLNSLIVWIHENGGHLLHPPVPVSSVSGTGLAKGT